MRHSRYTPSPLLTVTLLLLSLSGCGGGGDSAGSSSDSTADVAPPDTDNGLPPDDLTPIYDDNSLLLICGEQDEHILDLARFVPEPGIALTDARMDGNYSNVCHSPYLSALPGDIPELALTADHYGLCHLLLTFEQDGQAYTRPLTINYTRTPQVQIPVLGEVFAVNEHRTVELADNPAIKALLDQGYSLPTDSIGIAGTISAMVVDTDADGHNDSIAISGGRVPGPNRITYLLEQSGDKPDVKTGIIDVTVSASPNSRPQILQNNYTLADLTSPGDQAHINLLSNADKIVSDPDNEADLRLVKLAAPMGGIVTPGTSSNPLTGLDSATTDFHFSANAVGEYQVNYTVSDGKEGFASGVVNINVGKLTSPDSPLAATPGRGVKWTTVSDGQGNELVVNRPVLFDEFTVITTPDGSDNYVTRAGEDWADTGRDTSGDFCATFGLKLITATAFSALLNKYSGAGKTITTELGWPDDSNYAIQLTDRQETRNKPTMDPRNGNLTASPGNKGLAICVKSPEKVMTVAIAEDSGATGTGSEADPILMAPVEGHNQVTLTISNVGGSGVPTCLSSDTKVLSASCTVIANGSTLLTLTSGTMPGSAIVTVRTPTGENLLGNEPPLTLHINADHSATSGVPTLPTYKIQAQVHRSLSDSTLEWVTVIDQNGVQNDNRLRVRPATPLQVTWDFSDPDNWQMDATTVQWGSNVRPNSSNNRQATVTGFGDVTMTLKPTSTFDGHTEAGTDIPLLFQVSNEPPVISDLDITPGADIRAGTAFDQGTAINAAYAYSDPNNDPEKSASYIWEQKRPWTENWGAVTDHRGIPETSAALSNSTTNEFFAADGRYEGNDLRLRMTVQDEADAHSAEATRMIYPVAPTDTTTITLRALNTPNPLLLHRLFTFQSDFQENDPHWYDGMCAENEDAHRSSTYTQLRALRHTSLATWQEQKKTPKYWSPEFVTYPKIPFIDTDNHSEVWDASTGNQLATAPSGQRLSGDGSYVCEEVLLDALQIAPTTANVELGQTLQMNLIGNNATGQPMIVATTPTDTAQLAAVTWHSNTPAVATIGAEGLLTPVAAGTAEITATLFNSTYSRQVSVVPASSTITSCGDRNSDTSSNGNCLRYAGASDSSKWFSSPPSVTLVDALGYSETMVGTNPRAYLNTLHEEAGVDPTATSGNYVRFADTTTIAGVNQRQNWCQMLADKQFAGRDTWRLPTRAELGEAYGLSPMTTLKWPVVSRFASSDVTDGQSSNVSLADNSVAPEDVTHGKYVSCVANP